MKNKNIFGIGLYHNTFLSFLQKNNFIYRAGPEHLQSIDRSLTENLDKTQAITRTKEHLQSLTQEINQMRDGDNEDLKNITDLHKISKGEIIALLSRISNPQEWIKVREASKTTGEIAKYTFLIEAALYILGYYDGSELNHQDVKGKKSFDASWAKSKQGVLNKALKKFQAETEYTDFQNKKLNPDGILGPRTIAALIKALQNKEAVPEQPILSALPEPAPEPQPLQIPEIPVEKIEAMKSSLEEKADIASLTLCLDGIALNSEEHKVIYALNTRDSSWLAIFYTNRTSDSTDEQEKQDLQAALKRLIMDNIPK